MCAEPHPEKARTLTVISTAIQARSGLKQIAAKEPRPKRNGKDIRKSFRQLKLRLIAGLLAAFLLPLLVLTAYFHFQFSFTLKSSGKLNLAALSESQGNTIDLFLQERVVNLFNLFHGFEFNLSPSRDQMQGYLQNLRQVSDAFVDVGFLNSGGIQIGYAGPFPYLQGKNYSGETWFKTLVGQEKGYYISDIYLGFRNKPHFTIATRQKIDGRIYVMRSTLDPDKLNLFLRTISHGEEVESALINVQGLYQVIDSDMGALLAKSEFIPPRVPKTGVQEIARHGDSILIAYTWLKETQWALLVTQPLSIAHARMYQARKVLAASSILLFLSISALIYFSTTKLIDRAQATAEKGQELQYQLLHASKMASVGELATGVAHEINNPLAIIISTAGVIRDMFNPEFKIDAQPENILHELSIIESAAFRASKITRQLLDFGRKNEPKMVLCNVNAILDELTGGLKARVFRVEDIELQREYDPDLPATMLDPDLIRQVFLNILNNAGDAIKGPGTITITTAEADGRIQVTIKDTGVGMTPEQLTKIFDPFYTTKEVGKGTGLGLSVSLSILESMGGSISVQSLKGSGSSFTVTIPIRGASEYL